jgi:hypothetical protein
MQYSSANNGAFSGTALHSQLHWRQIFAHPVSQPILENDPSMTGTVKVANGIIPLPPALGGAGVQLIVPDSPAQLSFADRYAAYIGAADDLPTDLSANLYQYISTFTDKASNRYKYIHGQSRK